MFAVLFINVQEWPLIRKGLESLRVLTWCSLGASPNSPRRQRSTPGDHLFAGQSYFWAQVWEASSSSESVIVEPPQFWQWGMERGRRRGTSSVDVSIKLQAHVHFWSPLEGGATWGECACLEPGNVSNDNLMIVIIIVSTSVEVGLLNVLIKGLAKQA